MEKQRFFDNLYSGKLTRRDINKGLAAAGLATVTLPMGLSPARAETGKVPMILDSGGDYDNPGLYGNYLEKYGAPPKYSFFSEEEEAMLKIVAGFPADVTHPCSENMRRWVDHGVIKPIDTSRLSNWPDLFPVLKAMDGVIIDGNAVMVPLDWGNSSVVYRTDLASEYVGNESWNILFDEKYKGRVSMQNARSTVVVAGVVLFGDDVWNMSAEQLAECRKLLEKQVKLSRFYWNSQTEIETALASGELVAAYAWNDAYVRLKKQGVPVAYMKPKEGILSWVCGKAMLNTGEGDEQLVYDFIDAWASPETGKFMISEFGYGHSNRKAWDLVDSDTISSLGFSSDPSEMLSDGYIFRAISHENEKKYIQMFEQVKAEAGL